MYPVATAVLNQAVSSETTSSSETSWERIILISLVIVHIATTIILFGQGHIFFASVCGLGALLELKMSRDIALMLDLQAENKKLKETVSALEKQLEDLRSHINNLSKENQAYSDQNLAHRALIDQLQYTHEKIARDVRSVLEGQGQMTTHLLQDITTQSNNLQNQLHLLQQMHSRFASSNEGFTETMTVLARTLAQTDAQRLASVQEATRATTQAAAQVETAHQELARIQSNLAKTTELLETETAKLSQIRQEIEEATVQNTASAAKIAQALQRKGSIASQPTSFYQKISWFSKLFFN